MVSWRPRSTLRAFIGARGKIDAEAEAAVRTRCYRWFSIWSSGLGMVTEAWQRLAASYQIMYSLLNRR